MVRFDITAPYFKRQHCQLFCFFTILSNLLVAISLTALVFAAKTNLGYKLSLPTTKSAVALYILIVGLVYNLVLRGIWEPKGWQLIADNLLHVIVPIAYLTYWLIFTGRKTLNYKDILSWTIFPFLYLIYSLIRGYYVNWYPYPFLDVAQFGYQQILINAFFVMLAFVGFATIMVWFNKTGAKEA